MTAHEFFATNTRVEKHALLQRRREHEAKTNWVFNRSHESSIGGQRDGRLAGYLWMDRCICCVRSFDIKIITVMRSCWEKTARRPRITRRWWAPPGTQDEENQQP